MIYEKAHISSYNVFPKDDDTCPYLFLWLSYVIIRGAWSGFKTFIHKNMLKILFLNIILFIFVPTNRSDISENVKFTQVYDRHDIDYFKNQFPNWDKYSVAEQRKLIKMSVKFYNRDTVKDRTRFFDFK